MSLDYANTRSWRGTATPTERLHRLSDVLDFIERSVAEPGSLRSTRDWADQHTRAAQKIFAAAIAMRETIFRIFSAIADERAVAERDLIDLNAALAKAPARQTLVSTEIGFGWAMAHDPKSLSSILAPVLWSAADLLVGADRVRIRRCASPECQWLFIDRSKTGTRRWCDMSSCGNRAKARRHYAKVRQV